MSRYTARIRVNWARLLRHVITLTIIGFNAPWWVTVLAFTLTVNGELHA